MRGKLAHYFLMTGEVWCWQILGEYVCEHVCCGTVDESAYSILDSFSQSVDSAVYVLGPVVGDWIFSHHAAAAVVLVERRGCDLLDSDVF